MAAVDFEKGDKTMAFLKSHRLPPSPQNYTLAYIALFDSGSPIGRAIQEIVDEGYRPYRITTNKNPGLVRLFLCHFFHHRL